VENDFDRYLSQERGLSMATRVNYRPFIQRFLSEQFGAQPIQFAHLRAKDVIPFVRNHAHKLSPKRAGLMVSALRSFLRYLRHRGDITTDLAACVPSVASWSFSSLPKFLQPHQVRRVLNQPDRRTAQGRRDYAILLLLARLGVRACEIVALTLDDIHWERGEITLRGKGGRLAQLPLPPDVGKALARRCPMMSVRRVVQQYLTMRRSLGFKLHDMGRNLRHFVSFMEQQGASLITTDLALRWARQPQDVQPAQWAARLSSVRSFARYWSATDPQTEIPPLALLPHRYKRPIPYIYSNDEIQHLLKAAKNLPPPTGLRPWTYHCLFGLMAVTGLRISEAIGLDRQDVDLEQGLLTVRLTKFGKSRLVPLHPSTVNRLKRYVRRRDDLYPRPPTSRFFLSNRGVPLTHWIARRTFVKLSRQIGLRKTSDLPVRCTQTGRFGPRLHDLRHRFAVTTLLHWYRTGVDVEQRLPVLSTYLGHAHVTDTYWYLSAIPELLALTKDRLEKRWEAFS